LLSDLRVVLTNPIMSQVVVINKNKLKNKNKQKTKIIKIVKSKINKKQKRNRRTGSRVLKGVSFAKEYLKCLLDPFNSAPVRSGFGVMVPTQVHTAYLRTTITTASDGSFSAFVLPNQNNLLLTTTALFADAPNGLATQSALAASANAAVLNKLINSNRTLGLGIRLYPQIAATSLPGIISMGCAPRTALCDCIASTGVTGSGNEKLFNQSTSNISALPYLREHMARPGGSDYFQCTWRPTDVKDFEFSDGDTALVSKGGSAIYQPFFNNDLYDPTDTTIDTQGSYLVVTGQSMPASTKIFVEVIMHFESTSSTDSISTIAEASNVVSDSVADQGEFSSMEQMYRKFRALMPTADSVVGAANSPLGQRVLGATTSGLLGLMAVRSHGYELV